MVGLEAKHLALYHPNFRIFIFNFKKQDKNLAPLPPKGEFHSKDAKIVHFGYFLCLLGGTPPLGVGG